jgi:hypothetical protein
VREITSRLIEVIGIVAAIAVAIAAVDRWGASEEICLSR